MTLHAEDEYHLGAFNFQSNGFRQSPTIHYFKPAMTYMQKYWQIHPSSEKNYRLCYASKQKTQIMLDWVRDYVRVYKHRKYFGLIHLSSVTHHYLNGFHYIKDIVSSFIKDLVKEGHLNRTVLLFYSDHGYRMPSEFVNSDIGDYEQRTPFVYFLFPKWFLEKYQHIHNALKVNSRRLTSNFDIHETLLDILNRNFKFHSSRKAHHKGTTLFAPVPFNRNCEEAGVPAHYCLCYPFKSLKISDKLAQIAGKHLLNNINTFTQKARDLCVFYHSAKVLSAQVHEKFLQNDQWYNT